MNDFSERERSWLLEEKYKGVESQAFFDDLKKLKTGSPLAYLIGNMPFLNCTIDLTYKPLIPRSETEFWVDHFIKSKQDFAEQNPARKIKILDMFSGSGCVGVGVLKNLKNVHVDFSEIDKDYIKQIKKNILLNIPATSNNYNIYESDVFENIPKEKYKVCHGGIHKINSEEREDTLGYDVILANPPYIAEGKKNTVQKSVLDNENHSTLFTSDDGLFFLKEIINKGQHFLKPKGEIWIEFDPWQVPLIEKFLKNEGIKNFTFWKDQYDRNRVLIVRF